MYSVPIALASFAAAALPQGPPGQLEVVPLGHIASRATPTTPPPWGSLLHFAASEDRPDLLGSRSDEAQYPMDACCDLLRGLSAEAIDAGHLRIDAVGTDLFVLGEPAAVARVRDQVRDAGEVMARALQVEVALWDGSGKPLPATILDPRAFAQWTADQRPLWQSTAETRSGRVVALDRQRWTRYVRDVEVEVAQKAFVGRPRTDAFGDGGRIVVCPHSLVGGDDVVLFVQFGIAQKRGAVRTLQTGITGLPDLEQPVLESVYGACSGRVQNGGALAVAMVGHATSGGQFVLTVRVTGRTPPPPPPASGLAIYPCGALTAPHLTQRMVPPSPYPVLGDEPSGEAGFDEEEGALHGEQLVDLLRTALGTDAETMTMHTGGGHLFVLGNDGALPKVEAVLRGLQERLLKVATVRHTGRLESGEPLQEIVFPTLLGRYATIARVLETTAVRDLFVEIAQEATMLCPIVTTVQSGCWLRARVGDLGQGRHLDLFAQCAHAVPPQPRSTMPTGGVLTPTDVASVRATHSGGVLAGQEIAHGDGPIVTIDGRSQRSSLATALIW